MKHTFVQVDANGEMIKKWNGSADVNDIVEQIGGEAMMEKEEAIEADESQEAAVVEPVALAGSYAEYDSSLVGATEDTVLFFYAAWCPSCTAADSKIM